MPNNDNDIAHDSAAQGGPEPLHQAWQQYRNQMLRMPTHWRVYCEAELAFFAGANAVHELFLEALEALTEAGGTSPGMPRPDKFVHTQEELLVWLATVFEPVWARRNYFLQLRDVGPPKV